MNFFYKHITFFKKNIMTAFLLLTLIFTSGCSKITYEPISESGFYFNTVISVTIYDPSKEHLLEECFSLAKHYENLFSRTIADSDISKINNAYQQICGKVNTGQEKIEQVRTFLNDQENRKTIGLLWRQVKKLLRHVLPRKISGRVRFGFDDPATTGQILTYISPFYGLYAKTLKLEPIFEEKVLDGELHVKGHIRAATLLWIVIRVVLNKNFRVLLKKAMALGKK